VQILVRYTATVLNAHQLAPLFDGVVSGDTLPRKNPDPTGIQSRLDQFAVLVDSAPFVGVSSTGIATHGKRPEAFHICLHFDRSKYLRKLD